MADQGIDLRHKSFGIGFIGRRIRRIGFDQRFLYFMDQRLGVDRIEPYMRIRPVMIMAVMTGFSGFMLVMIVIMVVGLGLFGMIVVVMVVIIGLGLFGMIVVVMVVIIGLGLFGMIVVVMVVIIGLGLIGMIVMVVVMIVGFGLFGVIVMIMVVMIGLGFLGMIVVIVIIMVGLCLMSVIIMTFVVMAMRFKSAAFAEVQFDQTMRIQQLHACGTGCNGLKRLFKERFQVMPHPEHNIGILQHGSFRRFHVVSMGRASAFDDESGFTGALHDGSDQRMHRFDGSNNIYVRVCCIC